MPLLARTATRSLAICLLLISGTGGGLSWAQPADTLIHHTLGEIVVGPDSAVSVQHNAATLQRIGLAAISQSDAASVDRVLRSVPGAHLQTNSRGETLVYLRGAGERQVAVFFDGALLNVPWDNRIDLSLVPAEVVGEITVVKGPPPVVYGTNVMGGAINLTSRRLDYTGQLIEMSLSGGSYGALQARAQYLRRTGAWSVAAYSGFSTSDGIKVPDGARLPYSQQAGALRTNTQRRLWSAYGQIAYEAQGGVRIGASMLWLSGEKGIAPEGHHDPEVARVRYWQYPDWQSMTFIASGLVPLGSRGVTIRGTAWTSRFLQSIHQFASVRYAQEVETQEDDDATDGFRFSYYAPLGRGTVTAAASWLSSVHRQVDKEMAMGQTTRQEFMQRVYSVGIEYTSGGPATVTLGASVDGVSTPQTGDKPPRGPGQTYSAMAGISAETVPGVRARASVGRKVRFPTMRELFGEALGRFLVNPDLGPEHSFLSEVGATVERGGLTAEVVGFYNRTYDTIDQLLVSIEGEERPRRQRVNIPGSRVIGLESSVGGRVARGVSLRCNVTTLYARALARDGRTDRLTEKPAALGQCIGAYKHPGGLSLRIEYVMTGTAYGLADSGALVPLPTSHVVSGRTGYLFLANRWAAEVFARVNNLTDTVTLPQLGLPGPGRAWHAGILLTH